MPQSFVSLHVHIIFSTKNRQPSITDDLQTRLYEYLGGIVRADGGRLLAAGGMPDHVHLLVSSSKQVALADTVRTLRATRRNGFMKHFQRNATSPGRQATARSR